MVFDGLLQTGSRFPRPDQPHHLLPQGVTFPAWALDFKSSLLLGKDTRIPDG
jgi:hypothetical protein